MTWIIIVKLILELLSKLPLEQQEKAIHMVERVIADAVNRLRTDYVTADDQAIENLVRELLSEPSTAGFADIDWEAAIPHIVALVKIIRAGFANSGTL
jgi:hypothetical protein